MALSNQINFLAFPLSIRWLTRILSIPEYDNTLLTLPREMALRCQVWENWHSAVGRLWKVNVSVTKRIADCWKELRSVTLTRKISLLVFTQPKIVLCSPCNGTQEIYWIAFKAIALSATLPIPIWFERWQVIVNITLTIGGCSSNLWSLLSTFPNKRERGGIL